jgi:hypothetical protein
MKGIWRDSVEIEMRVSSGQRGRAGVEKRRVSRHDPQGFPCRHAVWLVIAAPFLAVFGVHIPMVL